jgi:hypothetical protein
MSANPSQPPEEQPETDRRTRAGRRKGERRQREEPVPVERRSGTDRRKGPRRKRSINQYDMDDDVLEFINAVNRFKQSSGRPFPTWSEVLGILRDLGWEKRG